MAKKNTAQPATAQNFDDVYKEYFSFAWRSLRGLGVPEAIIDDAAQDVFVVVHRKLHTVTEPQKTKSWIFSIARRVASDYRRSAKRKGAMLELDETQAANQGPDPHETMEARQILTVVESFLSELDDEHRAIFVLSEVEQLPAIQISEMLKVNMNTIYTRLKVMKNNLALFLAKRNIQR